MLQAHRKSRKGLEGSGQQKLVIKGHMQGSLS